MDLRDHEMSDITGWRWPGLVDKTRWDSLRRTTDIYTEFSAPAKSAGVIKSILNI